MVVTSLEEGLDEGGREVGGGGGLERCRRSQLEREGVPELSEIVVAVVGELEEHGKHRESLRNVPGCQQLRSAPTAIRRGGVGRAWAHRAALELVYEVTFED